MCWVSRTKRGRLELSLETSKGARGSPIYHIYCLRREHSRAYSLELLGISHHGTDLESRSRGLASGHGAGCATPESCAASDEDESPEKLAGAVTDT